MPSAIDPLPAPLLLDPVFQARPWGGRRLAAALDKQLPEGQPIGESWEVSDRPEGSSRVASGPLAGRTLTELQDGSPLPLLFKFLDCRLPLSLQVHPDDAAAAAHGDQGKEEAWYVIEADPGAYLYVGFARATTPEAVRQAVAENRLETLLQRFTPRPGDVFHLPPGTVHAIGPGLVLAEIQQSSNLTYRLHDWGRLGLDGRPRELHLEQGLQVIDCEPWSRQAPAADGPTAQLVAGRAFEFWRTRLDGRISRPTAGRPVILACLSGEACLDGLTLSRGRCALVPAALDTFSIEGRATLLVATTADA